MAEQALSLPTRVTDSPEALAKDASIRLSGQHGSKSARVSWVALPFPSRMSALGSTVVLLCSIKVDKEMEPADEGGAEHRASALVLRIVWDRSGDRDGMRRASWK
ncbi:uncharacterized protein [Drosophila virilis]|uniref:uncharacterized protein n=1 Tax=Drosophila virilis TaxID=7244 RepID=UPI0038B30F1C